jgi:hypothetical protein
VRSEPGAIVIPSTEVLRFPAFVGALQRLLVGGAPEGSALFWHQGVDIPYMLNHGIRRMLLDPALSWVWIMGDDHTFEPDILMRLLAHEVPVVAPLVLRRNSPHRTVAFDEQMKPISFPPDAAGLVPVHAVGNAGMLIRRSVLELIADPWFVNHQPERANEDMAFCKKLRDFGIQPFVDVDTFMGHITPMEVWPYREADGAWRVKVLNKLSMEVL